MFMAPLSSCAQVLGGIKSIRIGPINYTHGDYTLREDPRIWTIGHSTRPLGTFLAMLAQHRIEAVADVRRFPGSRRQPQFGGEPLRRALAEQGIAYRWIEPLGGRRRPLPDSPNVAWRNASFRGYADHIGSAEFAGGLSELLEVAGSLRTSMMCAEAVWWRCHRALISDVLCVRGIEVVHIIDETHAVRSIRPYPLIPGRGSRAPSSKRRRWR
jgi:uncharacterized protein (DUF488 family)